MKDQSKKSNQKIFEGLGECISLPESPAGNEDSNLPDGDAEDVSGPPVVHVLHSRSQEERILAQRAAKETLFRILYAPEFSSAVNAGTIGTPTIDTFGQKFIGSCASAVLTCALANRLRATMDLSGSPEYVLRWKCSDMVLGPSISRLVGSLPRTSGQDSFGWRMPDSNQRGTGHQTNLEDQATLLSGWPTASARDWKDGTSDGKVPSNCLLGRVAWDANLAGWVSPTAQDSVRGAQPPRPQDTGVPLGQMAAWATPRASEHGQINSRDAGMAVRDQVKLALWPSPLADKLTPSQRSDFTPNLAEKAELTAWATPDAQAMNVGCDPEKHRSRLERLKAKHGNGNGAGTTLGAMVSGATTPSSPCATEKAGVFRSSLNPYFSAFLMGYPKEWVAAGRRAASRFARKSKGAPCSSKDSETALFPK